jgi:hypothetical protein
MHERNLDKLGGLRLQLEGQVNILTSSVANFEKAKAIRFVGLVVLCYYTALRNNDYPPVEENKIVVQGPYQILTVCGGSWCIAPG